jgi:LysM repeat protein
MNQTYTVKAGDTLYGISNQFGVSVTELAEVNNIRGDNLKVGQVLTIPRNSGTNPNAMFMYTVKAGDTLYSIAQKYNTTVGKIVDLNYLKTNDLKIGQVLRIPEMYTKEDEISKPSYKNYTVKKGDSLYSIGRANNLSVDTLMKDNALTSVNLSIGQILKIRLPQDSIDEEEECYGTDYTPPGDNFITYTVKKGDSLYSIANKYNTSVTAIQKLNNLSNNNLKIGQILKIPSVSNNTSSTIYTVKKGDSLYSIAKKYNTTADAIKRKNNLSSNLLSIGQKLNI